MPEFDGKPHPYLTTETYYQGKLIGADYVKENPEIKVLLPSQEDVKKYREKILEVILPNQRCVIRVSENGIMHEFL